MVNFGGYLLAFLIAALFNSVVFGAALWIMRPSFFDGGIFWMVGFVTLGFGLPVMAFIGFPVALQLERRSVRSPIAWVAVHIAVGCIGMLLGLAIFNGPANFFQTLQYDPRIILLSLMPAALTASATGLGYWAIAVK
jgi:hypothetical protein